MQGEATLLGRLSQGLAGGEAEAFEGYLTQSSTSFTRLANSEVIQDSFVEDCSLTVRALADGRLGEVTTNDLSADGFRRARLAAAEIARSKAGKPTVVGFSNGSTPLERVGSVDEETAALTPVDRHRYLSAPLSLADDGGVLLAGNCHTGVVETAMWNTVGLARYSAATRAEANLIALDGLAPGDSTGYAGNLASALRDVDLGQLADDAVAKAVRGRDPIELEPDTYDVVLEPAAVAQLLQWLNIIGFDSQAVQAKTSFMADRLGEAVTGPEVTITDDPTREGAVGIPFDVEGTPKQRLTLIEEGVARQHVFNRAEAAKAGCSATGHALKGTGFGGGSAPTQLAIEAGNEDPHTLLGKVERGLWVTRFHYVNGMLEPRRAVMTGLTRNGTFEIRDGTLGRGVHNLRFTDSVLEAFARIEGRTAATRTTGTWWSALGSLTAPTLLIRGLRFTGKTRRS